MDTELLRSTKDPLDLIRPRRSSFIDFSLQKDRPDINCKEWGASDVNENRFNPRYSSATNVKHTREISFDKYISRKENLFGATNNSPHVLSANDVKQLSKNIAPGEKEFIDLSQHRPKYYKNDLVKDNSTCLRKSLPNEGIQFDKGLLRTGTVLRYKGFVITDKGKKVDTALLNADNLKDRFELEKIRIKEERQKAMD